MLPHASKIEYALIIVSSFGLLINFSILLDAVGDANFVLKAHKDGLLHHIASANVREELFRVTKQFVFLFAGIICTLVAPPPPPLLEAPQSIVLIIGMISVSFLMALNAYLSRLARKGAVDAGITNGEALHRRKGD